MEGKSMKNLFSAPRAFAGASAILAIPVAVILSQPLPLSAGEFMRGIVNGKTDQGYPFASGGVGTEERELMRKEAQRYDLDLGFADRTGDYLSDVNLTITDKHGNQVVDTTTAGPWFYIELPDGKYDVRASYDNQTEEIKNLEVSKNHLTTRLLHWELGGQKASQG
jgi:hypothetical protein